MDGYSLEHLQAAQKARSLFRSRIRTTVPQNREDNRNMTHLRTIAIAIAATALFTVPLLAHAAAPMPDVKGTWTGKTLPIVAGSGGHWPDNKGTFDNPGLPEGEVKITIKGQNGQRFWGSKTISGG